MGTAQIRQANLLSIIQIFQEAQLQRIEHDSISEWRYSRNAQTHLIGATIYGIKKAIIHPERGVIYFITIDDPKRKGARIVCVSVNDLETEVITSPENILERKGVDFLTHAQASMCYDRIIDQSNREGKAFSEYLTS